MKRHMVLLILLLVTVVSGCQKQKEEAQKQADHKQIEPQSPHHVAKKETTVIVPEVAKGKWKAVKIKVSDKDGEKQKVYAVNIGEELPLGDTGLKIKVQNFLPDFIMAGATLTSQSNELRNPAAQIRIYEGQKEIFKGWLFAKFPTTHSFQHPRYGFTLVDYVPAK